MEKPQLSSAKFIFYQDGNCVDGGDEELEIRCESSLGVSNDKGSFYVLKTNQWAIDSIEDLQSLISNVENSIKCFIEKE